MFQAIPLYNIKRVPPRSSYAVPMNLKARCRKFQYHVRAYCIAGVHAIPEIFTAKEFST
jgi:hypothetical protein